MKLAFTPAKLTTPSWARASTQRRQRVRSASCSSNPDPDRTSSKAANSDVGLGLKSVWMGAEALGNVVGAMKKNSPAPDTQDPASTAPSTPPSETITRESAIAAIKADYDVNYFVSGAGDMAAYDPQCRFADPFASFTGAERFKRNVGNLGGMLRDIKLDITDWKEDETAVTTKWKFSAILDLPWKPRLAAAGGTVHRFDPGTGRVVEHIESWDVDPGQVVRSLLKPSAKVPTSQWDVLMNAVYDGDAKGIWLATSGEVAKVSAALVGVSLLLNVVTGDGQPAAWLFGVVLGAALVTEVLKMATGMLGGESGGGGGR